MKLFSSNHFAIGVAIVSLSEVVKAQGTGKFSDVRQGALNNALGDFCSVGGGENNSAGAVMLASKPNMYSTVGGGTENLSDGEACVISGGSDNKIFMDGPNDAIFSSISGGTGNQIQNGRPNCAITGGIFNTVVAVAGEGTISGGINNMVTTGLGNVVSGGKENKAEGKCNAVVSGGRKNCATGKDSSVLGGTSNDVKGAYSLAFGQNAVVSNDSSMVVNLLGTGELASSQDGQFLVKANSYTFLVGAGTGKEASITIDASNIGNLIDALA